MMKKSEQFKKTAQEPTDATTTIVFDRVLRTSVPGIATDEDLFNLDNGYYVNETESVIIKSTNETGRYFKKISGNN
jgi:hypothetical protein